MPESAEDPTLIDAVILARQAAELAIAESGATVHAVAVHAVVTDPRDSGRFTYVQSAMPTTVEDEFRGPLAAAFAKAARDLVEPLAPSTI